MSPDNPATGAFEPPPWLVQSGWRYAVCVDQVGTDQRADQPHPLLDQVDRRAVELERVAAAEVAPQIKAAAVALTAQMGSTFISVRAAIGKR